MQLGRNVEDNLNEIINTGDYDILDSTELFYRSYNKTELILISRQLGQPIKTKYKKGEVVDLFVKQFMNEEMIAKSLLTISDGAIQTLKDIVNEKVEDGNINLFDMSKIITPENRGFFFISDFETFVISEQAAKIIKKVLKNKAFQAKRSQLSYLNDVLAYCDIVYGVINLNYVQMLFQYKFPQASKKDIIDLYQQLPHPAMSYDENKKDFLSDFVVREKVYDDVIKMHQQNIISLPSKQELEDYIYTGFPYGNFAYQHFLLFLMLHLTDDLIQPIHDTHELFKAVSFEVPLQNIFKYFDDYLMDDDELETFVPLVLECFNTSRHFKTNGHVPDEDMMNLLQSGGSIPLPDDENVVKEIKEHMDELHQMGFDVTDQNEIVLKDRDDQDGFVS